MEAADTRRLVIVPAAFTLGVTLLRLVGELLRWSETLFNRQAGGPGALVGIVWLVPVFGVHFALVLARRGEEPPSRWKSVGLGLLALLIIPAGFIAVHGLSLPTPALPFAVGAVSLVAAALAYRGWPALGRTLLAYGLAVRVPVALVMLVALANRWGTHYELGAPGMPEMPLFTKWVVIGLVPQLTFWVGFTVTVGLFFGSLAAACSRRGAVRGGPGPGARPGGSPI